MWLPFLPSGKHVIARCSRCGETREKEDFSVQYKEAAAQVKRDAQTPLWVYIGLPVTLLLIFILNRSLY